MASAHATPVKQLQQHACVYVRFSHSRHSMLTSSRILTAAHQKGYTFKTSVLEKNTCYAKYIFNKYLWRAQTNDHNLTAGYIHYKLI